MRQDKSAEGGSMVELVPFFTQMWICARIKSFLSPAYSWEWVSRELAQSRGVYLTNQHNTTGIPASPSFFTHCVESHSVQDWPKCSLLSICEGNLQAGMPEGEEPKFLFFLEKALYSPLEAPHFTCLVSHLRTQVSLTRLRPSFICWSHMAAWEWGEVGRSC